MSNAPCIGFRRGTAMPEWAGEPPWLIGIEKEQQRRAPGRLDPTLALVESPEQLEKARSIVAEFVPVERINEAAVLLCLLRNARPGRTIKRSDVLAKLEAV